MSQVVGLTPSEIASVRAPIADALTLPSRAFLSEEFFQLEIEKVFHQHWMAVAFDVAIPHVGDVRPIDVLGMPLLMIRGDDGQVRVFHNICPYDGSLVATEPLEAVEGLEVLYHGWKYDLRGRLTEIPHWDGTPAGNLGALGDRCGDLVEVRTATSLGVVFADLGGNAGSIEDYLRPLRALLVDYDLDALVQVEDDGVRGRLGRTLNANWKTYLENAAINILHESFVHDAYRESPDIPRVKNGRKTFAITAEGPLMAFSFDMNDVAATYPTNHSLPHLGHAGKSAPDAGYFITYYPNVVIPIRPNMMRLNICLPESPGVTRITHCGYFQKDAPNSPAFAAFHKGVTDHLPVIYEEDRIVVEAVQKARRSPVWSQHFYTPFWDELHYRLNNLVADDMSIQ